MLDKSGDRRGGGVKAGICYHIFVEKKFAIQDVKNALSFELHFLHDVLSSNEVLLFGCARLGMRIYVTPKGFRHSSIRCCCNCV